MTKKEYEAIIAEKNAIIDSQKIELTVHQALIAKLEKEKLEWIEKYKIANDKKFGRKSEKQKPSIQRFLVNELEDGAESKFNRTKSGTEDQTAQKVKSYIRHVAKNKILHLPKETKVVDIYTEEDADPPVCTECSSSMKRVGELVDIKIAYIPAHYFIVKVHRPEYRCLSCAPMKGENPLVAASPDGNVLPGTICDPSLLALIIESRMKFGLPLYRLEDAIKLPDGQKLSRQLLSSWCILAYQQLIGLEKAFLRRLYRYPMISMDETPLLVLNNTKRTAEDNKIKAELDKLDPEDPDYKEQFNRIINSHKKSIHNAMNCFMMVRAATNKDSSRGLVMYTFSEYRNDKTIKDMIGPYDGFLMSDGLSGYANAVEDGNYTHGCCMVHGARKPKAILENHPNNKIASELVGLYQAIFHENNNMKKLRVDKGLSDEEFIKVRKEKLEPLFAKLKEWLDSIDMDSIADKNTASIIKYAKDRFEKFKTFMDFACGEIDNSYAERCVKSFILGRKAFLFSNTVTGANASAFYYSIVESCKALKVDPFLYLVHIFMVAGNAKTEEDWDGLLPDAVDLQSAKDYIHRLSSEAKIDPMRTKPYVLRGTKRK